MKNISLIYRHHSDGVSIQKVFDVIYPILSKNENISKYELPSNGSSIRNIIKNIWFIIKQRKQNTIFHITGATHYLSYFLPNGHTLTTVHDLNRFVSDRKDNCLTRLVLKILFLWALKRNEYIVCISEKTKNELLKLILYPHDRIFVIPNPVSSVYKFIPKAFNEDCPTILHIGTKSNKNLSRTAQSLKGMKCILRIVGRLTPKDHEILISNEIDFVQVENLTEQELIQEYLNCDIVNFPSTYEGFGMPLIEAQAMGRICVTSNIQPMVSIAGEGGAILVDPYDIKSIRRGYIEIINNKDLRERTIRRGLENIRNYSAESIANQYINLYNKFKE